MFSSSQISRWFHAFLWKPNCLNSWQLLGTNLILQPGHQYPCHILSITMTNCSHCNKTRCNPHHTHDLARPDSISQFDLASCSHQFTQNPRTRFNGSNIADYSLDVLLCSNIHWLPVPSGFKILILVHSCPILGVYRLSIAQY